MRALTTHFRYALLKAWAEKRTPMLRLGLFVGITFILSTAFSSSFEKPDFDKVDVGYVSADVGKGGAEYFKRLAANEDFANVASFEAVDSFADGRRKVENGEIGALLYAPEDYTGGLTAADGHATVEVYSKKYSGIDYIVVRAVVDGFNYGANTEWAVKKLGRSLPKDGGALAEESLAVRTVSEARKMSSLTYYAVGMLLFLLLFGAEFGSFGISEEYLGALASRTRLAPQHTWQMFAGKLSAFSLVTFVQGGLYMLITGLLLGVKWGANLGPVLAVVFTFGAFAIALGMMIMLLTRDMKKTTTLIQVGLIGFTLLGGGFIATGFGAAGMASPNTYARDALFGAIFGDDLGLTGRNTGILWALTLALGVVGVLAARRRRTA